MAVLGGAAGHVHVVAATLSRLTEVLPETLDGNGPALLPSPPELFDDDLAFAREHTVDGRAALIVRTSGSTGHPKRVMLAASALLASARSTNRVLGEGQWLLALPVNYIAGVQVLVRGWLAGTQTIAVPSDHFRPDAFVAAADKLTAARRFTALVPVQVRDLLDAPSGDGIRALRSFAAVLVGGQHLDPVLARRAAEHGVRLVSTYGSTETSGGCVYDGRAMPGTSVSIVDGEVRLSGPTLALGYAGDAERTRASFVEAGGERWYRTGDLGTLRQGLLRVTGRADRIIVTGGLKLDLSEVERVLRTLPDMMGAVAVPVPDARWGTGFSIVVDRSVGETVSLERINALLRRELGRQAVARGLHTLPGGLPRLGNGKVDMSGLRRMVTGIDGDGR